MIILASLISFSCAEYRRDMVASRLRSFNVWSFFFFLAPFALKSLPWTFLFGVLFWVFGSGILCFWIYRQNCFRAKNEQTGSVKTLEPPLFPSLIYFFQVLNSILCFHWTPWILSNSRTRCPQKSECDIVLFSQAHKTWNVDKPKTPKTLIYFSVIYIHPFF